MDVARRHAFSAVVTFCAVDSFLKHVLGFTMCHGSSMEPTIDARGEIVLIDRTASTFGYFENGDVVIARSPIDPGKLVCKRIVGKEGDRISVMDTVDEGIAREVTVPRGQVWLQGDNLKTSRDSREYGPVPVSMLQGKAIYKIWPIDRIGPFGREVFHKKCQEKP